MRSLKKFLRNQVDALGLGNNKYKKQNYVVRHRRIVLQLGDALELGPLSDLNLAKLGILTFQTMGKFKHGAHLPEIAEHWDQIENPFYRTSISGKLCHFKEMLADDFGRKILRVYVESSAFKTFQS